MRRSIAAAAVTGATVLAMVTAAAAAGTGGPGPSTAGAPALDQPLRQVSTADLPGYLSRPEARSALRPEKQPQPAAPRRAPAKNWDQNDNKIADRLEEEMAGARDLARFDVLVLTSGAAEQTPAMQEVLAGADVGRTFRHAVQGFSARLTPEQIARLRSLPEVIGIEPNERVYAMLDSATYWSGGASAREDFWLTGNRDGFPQTYTSGDVVVAVIDTGIDAGHLDLRHKVIGWMDMVAGRPDPYDDNGHGTHVAGIAAGAGVANPALRGVAPGAALVGVKVLDAEGSGSFEDVIGGVEWVIANKDRYNIRVFNMSLGTRSCSDGQDALSLAVNNAVEAGLVAVVAAGNYGPDNCTIGSPGAAERAITIGMTQ